MRWASLSRLGNQVDRAASRLTVGIVTASLVIGSSIVLAAGEVARASGLHWFGLLGFAGAGIGGIWLLISIWHDGKKPRQLDLAIDCSINDAVSLAACAQRCARLRTWSATTAKPMPLRPPGGFHRCIQCQDVGLESDFVDALMILEILPLCVLTSPIAATVCLSA